VRVVGGSVRFCSLGFFRHLFLLPPSLEHRLRCCFCFPFRGLRAFFQSGVGCTFSCFCPSLFPPVPSPFLGCPFDAFLPTRFLPPKSSFFVLLGMTLLVDQIFAASSKLGVPFSRILFWVLGRRVGDFFFPNRLQELLARDPASLCPTSPPPFLLAAAPFRAVPCPVPKTLFRPVALSSLVAPFFCIKSRTT